MSIATITLTDGEEGEVDMVITASDVRNDSAAIDLALRVKKFIDDLAKEQAAEEQAKAEVAKPSSIIIEHLITCPHCMGAVDLRTAN